MAAEEPAEVASTPSLMEPSTNWVVVAGSLEQTVVFDTSSSFVSDDTGGNGGVSNAKGAVFLRAPSEEPDPCEIHVCFRQKLDIHRVYVRSTAHFYEIYHSLDVPLQNNEYLCTVRCGETLTEVGLPEVDGVKLPMEECTVNQASVDVAQILAKGTETNGSDEDGWIDVKSPDSPMVGGKSEITIKNFQLKEPQKTQIFYEATAEISDLGPCMSLTLRLLSLHSKGQVCIEEIYIYADPFESESNSCNPDATNLTSNIGGASLLSMLVPGLLQMSKSGNSRLKGKEISCGCKNDGMEETEKINPDMGRKILEEENKTMEETQRITQEMGKGVLKEAYFTDKKIDEAHEGASVQVSSGNVNSSSCKEVPTDHVDKCSHDPNSLSPSRTEKLLEELLSRVGGLENLWSSFDGKMVKSLVSIETRLQKVEQQLAVLTERGNFTEPLGPSTASVREFTCDESEPVNRGRDVLETPEKKCGFEMPRSTHLDAPPKMRPSFVFRAPEFVLDDDTPCCSNSSSYVGENLSEGKKSSHLGVESHRDSETDVSEETKDLKQRNAEECTDFSSEVDHHPCNNDASPTARSRVKDRSGFSIDMALASALDALMSAATISPACDHPVDPKESNHEVGKNNTHRGEVPLVNAERPSALNTNPCKMGSSPEEDKDLDSSHAEKSKEKEVLEFNFEGFSSAKEIDAQETKGDFICENVGQSGENHWSSEATARKVQNGEWCSSATRDWVFTSEACNAEDDYQPPMGNISETHDSPLPHKFRQDTGSMLKEAPTFGSNPGGSFADSDEEEPDHRGCKRRWFGESSTESVVEDLVEDSCRLGLNDLSSSDSEAKFPLPNWLTGEGSDFDTDSENLERVGVSSYHSDGDADSSRSDFASPRLGIETGNGLNISPDNEQLVPDFKASPDGNQPSDSLFRDLLREMSNVEVHSCESKGDDAREADCGPPNSSRNFDGHFTSSPSKVRRPVEMEESFQNVASACKSSTDSKKPLIDVEGMVSTIGTSGAGPQVHSRSMQPDQQPFFSSLI